MNFFLPMDPPTTTHQTGATRIVKGRIVYYEPQNLIEARSKIRSNLARYRPKTAFSGPIRFVSKWLFRIRKSAYSEGEWKITKPDCDNMIKLTCDVMEQLGYWKNDVIIASLIVEKFWSHKPGIYIEITSLKELS